MEVIYLLVPLSLVFLVVAVWIFFWAVRTAQFDDLDGPAHRLILDDREDRARQQVEPDGKPDDKPDGKLHGKPYKEKAR